MEKYSLLTKLAKCTLNIALKLTVSVFLFFFVFWLHFRPPRYCLMRCFFRVLGILRGLKRSQHTAPPQIPRNTRALGVLSGWSKNKDLVTWAVLAGSSSTGNLVSRVFSYPSLRSEREKGRKENLGTRLIHGSSHGKQRGVVFSFQFDIIIGCGRTRKTKTALSRTFECPIERLFNSV